MQPVIASLRCVAVSLLAFPFLLVPGSIHAQHTTGDHQIRVMDWLGDPIPGVNARVMEPSVQGIRGGVTDGLGHITVRSSRENMDPAVDSGHHACGLFTEARGY